MVLFCYWGGIRGFARIELGFSRIFYLGVVFAWWFNMIRFLY